MPLLYAIQNIRLRITRIIILWLAIFTVRQQNINFCDAIQTTASYKLQSTTTITSTMTVDLKNNLQALLFIFKGIAAN